MRKGTKFLMSVHVYGAVLYDVGFNKPVFHGRLRRSVGTLIIGVDFKGAELI